MNFLARVFARDLLELSRSRGLLVLLFVVPVLLLLLVGNLKVRDPVLRVAISMEAPPATLARLRSMLQEVSRVRVTEWTLAPGELQQRAVREQVDLVAVWESDSWRFYSPLTNSYRLQFAQGVAQDLTLSMQRSKRLGEQVGELDQLASELPPSDPASGAAGAVLKLQQRARDDAALPAPLLRALLANQLTLFYPPASRVDRSLVPGYVALITVFLPFLIASGALVREREAGTLQTLVMASRRNWARLVAGKLLLPTFVSLLATLLLLVVARSAFGYGLKPGLGSVLSVQLAAAVISALLGLGISTLLRSSQDAYTASSVYLVACILITGLIYPVEQAAWGVIGVSYAFPLTLSGHPLEEWMLKGAGAALEPWRLAGLAAQLVGALALCALAVQRLRRSL
jgi:ABC-type multidrug transport system permease subunit